MRKKTPISARKPSKKKPKDKPKRPLSAYNFFFKEERLSIIEERRNSDSNDDLNQNLSEKAGKVNFEELGQLIGQRWKNITTDRMAHCTKLAKADTERYRTEMDIYNETRERMRIEATPHYSSEAYMNPHPHYLQYYQPNDAGIQMYHGGYMHSYPNHYSPLQDRYSHAMPGYHTPPSGSRGVNAYTSPYPNEIGSCFSNSHNNPMPYGYSAPNDQMHPYSYPHE